MLRGNDGQPIFFTDKDRYRMCLLLQEGVERFGHAIHAFCFMTNHIHLAVQVRDVTISDIMHNLASRYTRYINKKYGRLGHLFQGRFKSIIVDDAKYFNELIRYIHLNPVRANLAEMPEKYLWSSHRAYLMLRECTWLTKERIYKNFGKTPEKAMLNFESYVLQGIGIESEIDFKAGQGNGVLGDEEFIEKLLANLAIQKRRKVTLPELIEKICLHFNLTETDLSGPKKNKLESTARGVLAYFVRETKNVSLEELGDFLQRDPSGLTKLANQVEIKCIQSEGYALEIQEIRNSIFDSILETSENQ